MIAYAAIDLRGGRVVQLVGGRVDAERVSLADPVAVARQWADAGFKALHVVDLDAALGTGDNRADIEAIVSSVSVPVQVGGGIRDDAGVAAMLDTGASRVIVGTRAIEDPKWRTSMAERFPGRLVVAADVRAGLIVTRGWQTATSHESEQFVRSLGTEPLAGVLVTDVSREGQMLGIDAALFSRLVVAARQPLIAAGGIRDGSDLQTLADIGAAGAVLGMALYQGALDVTFITREYAA